jgi:multidrug efflux system outer membrane protein
VLDAQRELYEDEDRLAQSEIAVITKLIALYRALGGGWGVGRRRATRRRI